MLVLWWVGSLLLVGLVILLAFLFLICVFGEWFDPAPEMTRGQMQVGCDSLPVWESNRPDFPLRGSA